MLNSDTVYPGEVFSLTTRDGVITYAILKVEGPRIWFVNQIGEVQDNEGIRVDYSKRSNWIALGFSSVKATSESA